ncbi:hypothetical protein Dimus_015488 [Dionaea muscipula]
MQELCKKNATNRAKQTNLHTCGPKSFAVIRERLKKEHNREPTLAEMFKKTRTRVLDPNGGIAIPTKWEKWEDAESSCFVDPFLAVMGKEHNGRVRLHGRGVTPSSLGKASTGNESSSINVPNELLESIKADVIALSDHLSDLRI